MESIEFRGHTVAIRYPAQRAYITDPVDVGVVREYIGAAANEYHTRDFRDGQAALAATAYAELVESYNQLRSWIQHNVTVAIEYTIENSGCYEGKTNFLRDIGIDTESLTTEDEVVMAARVTMNITRSIFDDGDEDAESRAINELPSYSNDGSYFIEWEQVD